MIGPGWCALRENLGVGLRGYPATHEHRPSLFTLYHASLRKQGLSAAEFPPKKPKRTLGQSRDAIRLKHYSYSTDKACVHRVKRYVLFHNKRHPGEMGARETTTFLTNLATHENVSASTQHQALTALPLWAPVRAQPGRGNVHPRPAWAGPRPWRP